MSKKYDIAAYIWPAYTGTEPRTKMFWPEGNGEWQTVRSAGSKFEGHKWPRRPLWGCVDEADPSVMEMEIDAAVSHGVNVFIYDWYWYDRRPFLEQCLNDGFLKAKNNKKMKFYLMWANHDLASILDKRSSDTCDAVIWQGAIDRLGFEEICNRLIEKYFTLDNYYKIDGKPVYMIYDLVNLVKGLGGIERAREALEWFREQVVKAGFPGLHLQATLWGEHSLNLSGVDGNMGSDQRELVEALGFDSGSNYQFCHLTDIRRDYSALLPDILKEWKRITNSYKIPYFPHVSMGWDNNPRYIKKSDSVMTGNTPDEVKKALTHAKAYVDSHPKQPSLITINSWNEWTESSYLEPDDLYGYGYLNAIKSVFGAVE